MVGINKISCNNDFKLGQSISSQLQQGKVECVSLPEFTFSSFQFSLHDRAQREYRPSPGIAATIEKSHPFARS